MADIGGSIRRGNTLTLILTLLEEEPRGCSAPRGTNWRVHLIC